MKTNRTNSILNILSFLAEKWFFIWLFCMLFSLGLVLVTPVMLLTEGYITFGIIWAIFIYTPAIVYFVGIAISEDSFE